MKMEQVFFLILTLALVFVLWHRHLGTRYSLALVADSRIEPRVLVGKRKHPL